MPLLYGLGHQRRSLLPEDHFDPSSTPPGRDAASRPAIARTSTDPCWSATATRTATTWPACAFLMITGMVAALSRSLAAHLDLRDGTTVTTCPGGMMGQHPPGWSPRSRMLAN